MTVKQPKTWLTEEIADFLASCPTRDQLMLYRPSARLQTRVRELLELSNSGQISVDDQWELDQFEHAEMWLQMIKTRLRISCYSHRN